MIREEFREADLTVASLVTDDENLLVVRQRTESVDTGSLLGNRRVLSLSKTLPNGQKNSAFGSVDINLDTPLLDMEATQAGLYPGGNFYIIGCTLSAYWVGVFDQSTGLPLSDFAADGFLAIPMLNRGCLSHLVLAENASALLVGTGAPNGFDQVVMYRMSLNGVVDSSWGNEPAGVLAYNVTDVAASSSEATCAFAVGNGRFFIGGSVQTLSANQRIFGTFMSASGERLQAQEYHFPDLRAPPGENVSAPFLYDNVSKALSCVRYPLSGGVLMTGLAPGSRWSALLLRRDSLELDDSFGGDGMVVLDSEYQSSRVDDAQILVSVMPTGSVVLAGSIGEEFPFRFASTRLLPDGSPDPSWQLNFSGFPILLRLYNVLVQNTGHVVLSGQLIDPSANAVSFRLHSELSAVPCDAGPQCFCVGTQCSTQSDFVVPPGGQLVGNNTFVNGNLIASNGTLTVQPLPTGPGDINVGGVLVAGGTLLVIVNASGTYQIAQADSISGDFENVVVSTDLLGECEEGIPTLQQSADGTTLSVTVVVQRASGCLRTAEIVGVSISALAVGVLVAVLLFVWYRRRTAMWTEQANKELNGRAADSMERGMIEMSPNPSYQRSSEDNSNSF